jgi:hypothetical protein
LQQVRELPLPKRPAAVAPAARPTAVREPLEPAPPATSECLAGHVDNAGLIVGDRDEFIQWTEPSMRRGRRGGGQRLAVGEFVAQEQPITEQQSADDRIGEWLALEQFEHSGLEHIEFAEQRHRDE